MSVPQPDDSLDNLSNLQLGKQRQLAAQVKQSFAAALQKLQFSETRQIGIAQLRKITEHYPQPQHLRGYMATLKTLKPNSNSATKEHQILVISLLAHNFRQNLLDPIDKPLSLLKSCFRLVEVLHNYFADRSPTVQKACARALLDINTYCLTDQPLDSVFQIIFSPLFSILRSGVDKGSQGTAASCLNQLIAYNRSVDCKQTLNKLAPQLLTVFLKVNSEYHQLFHAIYSTLQTQGLSFLEGRLVTFLAKILAVLAGTRDSQSNNSLNSYMCKVNVCKIVQKLGALLPMPDKQKLADLSVVQSLQQASRHRIIQVQMAASRALKSWKGELQQTAFKGLQSLQEKRNSKKKERSRSKEERNTMENQLTFMKQDLQKMVKGGWGASNRAKNYVKRGSGVGGGFHGKMEPSPPSRSNSKSHKQHIEQLRQYIKKGAESNKNKDKYGNAILQEPHQKNSLSSAKAVQHKVQKAIDGDSQFGVEEDSGDQMLAGVAQKGQKVAQKGQKVAQKGQKVAKKSHLSQVGITASQANQLVEHEQSIMEEGRAMNIHFYSQKSQKSRSVAYPPPSPVHLPNDSLEQHQPEYKNDGSNIPLVGKQAKNKNEGINIPLVGKQVKNNGISIPLVSNQVKNAALKSVERPSGGSGNAYIRISEQQIGQLIQECNLSQVSDNISCLLNDSDINALKNKEDTADHMFHKDQGLVGQQDYALEELQALRGAVASKKAKKSLIEPVVSHNNQLASYNNQVASYNNQVASYNNQVASYNEPQKERERVHKGELRNESNDADTLELFAARNMHQAINQQGVSLNFTQSIQSAKEQPINQHIQFTLNPKNDRFSSLKGHAGGHHKQLQEDIEDKQVEQEIVMSCYEQSIPKQETRKLPPLTAPPPLKAIPSSAREGEPQSAKQQGNQYQNIIKNPPKNTPFPFKSKIQNNQQSKLKSQVDQSEQPAVGPQWLQILGMLDQGQFDAGFEAVLDLDDPVYLLRAMLLTKCPLKKLSAVTAQQLWKNFLKLYSHHLIDSLAITLLEQGDELKLLCRCLSVQQLQDVLLGLYQVSGCTKGKLSYRAASLYNSVESSLRAQ